MIRLPPHFPGMRIGLFGGSFDPPHVGHISASLAAIRRLRLDRLWWLVSPGNPLKDTRARPTLEQRVAQARRLASHPKIVVTGLEAALGVRHTDATIDYLTRRCPGVSFVWIMGADNLLQFHRWRNWEKIAAMVPIAIIDRPGATVKVASARAAQRFAYARVDERCAGQLAKMTPPAFMVLHGKRNGQSSTALRAGINAAGDGASRR